MKEKPLRGRQLTEIYRVSRHETPEFGVIVMTQTGEALVRRGYAKPASRRRFARETDICIRLTEKGWAWVRNRG